MHRISQRLRTYEITPQPSIAVIIGNFFLLANNYFPHNVSSFGDKGVVYKQYESKLLV